MVTLDAQALEAAAVGAPVEQIALLQPDLIVAQAFAVEEIADQLRRIARLVILDYYADDTYIETKWEEHLRRVADAVSRPESADRTLAELDAAVEAFREDFPGEPADIELSIMKTRADTRSSCSPLSFQR